jgi:sugar lactone lactonase YvrE
LLTCDTVDIRPVCAMMTPMNRGSASTARVDTIAADLFVDAHATLGEGPVWDDAERCLWWVDILEGIVHRTAIDTADDERIPVGQYVGAVGLRTGGGLVAAVRDGFAMFDPGSGRLEVVADLQDEGRTLRMNDGKVDPGGRFWAGMMAVDHRPGAGTLYRLDADLTASPMVQRTSISNGLDWSPDGSTMYYIDSTPRRVDRFAYDAATGAIADRTTLIPIRDGAGFPDGMTVDAEGFLWVALWDGWGVERYAPDGRLDRRVEVPAAQASSCAFGGAELDLLFITTAQEGFPPGGEREQPHAGGVFVCRPGVRGRPPFRFAG